MTKIQSILGIAGILFAAACGGSSEPSVLAAPHFSAASVTMHAGETQNQVVLSGSIPISNSAVSWSSGNIDVARVDATGLVTAVAPGTTTINAVTQATQVHLSVTVAADLDPTGFSAPFTGAYPVVSVFDHSLPFEFVDTNGYLLSFWGEKLTGIDGHEGYDWLLPMGTAVLAAAPGTVTFAGTEQPFACPLLGPALVSGLQVDVMHGITGGDALFTIYAHFSRIDVKAGDRVSAGQQLGLSGSTGCSTTPHLHFGVERRDRKTGAYILADPFGWLGSTDDPWGKDPRGIASPPMWSAAGTPELYQGLDRTTPYPKPRFVDIKHFRLAGIDDDHHPNNEFVEFDVNPDSSWDFAGDTLRNGDGTGFVFPTPFRVAGGNSVRVYSGQGTNTASVLYMGRSTPVWRNFPGDCLRLIDKLNRILTGVDWGTGCNSTSTSANVIRLPSTIDYRPPDRPVP